MFSDKYDFNNIQYIIFIHIKYNMARCTIDHSEYKNNGLITKIWGGPGWTFNHSITFGYPLNPTDVQKNDFRNYFVSLGNVLPCRYCRESYIKFITSGDTALTDEVLTNRETLTKWFYDVHQAVNQKLEVDYGFTYDDLVEKYESFRAKCGKPSPETKGCIAPLDYKAFSFKKLYQFVPPIIPLETVSKFIPYAIYRGLSNEYFSYYKLALELNGDFSILKKLSSWQTRNEYCQYQIRYMREQAIDSIESIGKFKGAPTVDELKLILFMSSNLNKSELSNAITQLNTIMKKIENNTLKR